MNKNCTIRLASMLKSLGVKQNSQYSYSTWPLAKEVEIVKSNSEKDPSEKRYAIFSNSELEIIKKQYSFAIEEMETLQRGYENIINIINTHKNIWKILKNKS